MFTGSGLASDASLGSASAHRTCTSPRPPGTTFQELLGVRQGLVARADLAATLANSDGTSIVIELDGSGGSSPSGGRDVQLGLRPLGSGLAHHQDVCAPVSIEEEKPSPQPLALASNEACRAVPVGDRIPQLDKRRANAIEPSRLSGYWPTHHPRYAAQAPSGCHHSCRQYHRPPQGGGGRFPHSIAFRTK